MLKLLGLLSLSLLLVGCDGEKTKKDVQSRLPAGCFIYEFPKYPGIRTLIVVACEGRRTTTQNFEWQNGKTSAQAVSVWIEGLPGTL